MAFLLLIASLLTHPFSSSVAAGPPVSGRVEFRVTTHLGNAKAYLLEIQKSRTYLNGQELTKTQKLLGASNLLAVLANPGRSLPPTLACTMGEYEHKLIREGKVRVSGGCLGDPYSRRVVRAFESLVLLQR